MKSIKTDTSEVAQAVRGLLGFSQAIAWNDGSYRVYFPHGPTQKDADQMTVWQDEGGNIICVWYHNDLAFDGIYEDGLWTFWPATHEPDLAFWENL